MDGGGGGLELDGSGGKNGRDIVLVFFQRKVFNFENLTFFKKKITKFSNIQHPLLRIG